MAQNICKKCLLREMAEADQKMIEKYIAAIREDDRVSEDIYETRLSCCKNCDKLNQGTCIACGRYVELRALSLHSKCPDKWW